MRLYDLTEQYQDLLDHLRDEPDNEQFQAMLDGLEGKIEDKVENTIKVAKTLEYEAKALGEEIKRLQGRKSSIENNRKRLLENAQQILEDAKLDKLQGKLFNIWIQNNPPSVKILDESLIPKQFYKTPEPVLQRSEIMDAIKAGDSVPGVEIVQGRGLRVR